MIKKMLNILLTGTFSLVLINSNICLAENFSKKVVNVNPKKVDFTILNGNNVPNEIAAVVKNYNSYKGAFYVNKNGYIYIAIFSGEKPTSGYKLSITKAEGTENNINVYVKETVPIKDAVVNQVITYPSAFMKFKTKLTSNSKIKPVINVRINNGKIFRAVETSEMHNKNSLGDSFNIEKDMKSIDFSTVTDKAGITIANTKIKGFSYVLKDNYVYFIVCAGQKPTGGYAINVVDVKSNNDKTLILVKESNPAPNSITTQALTYPYTIIKFKNTNNNFIVKTVDGKDFKSEGVEK